MLKLQLLLQRYGFLFQQAWKNRHQSLQKIIRPDERAFLPAALELLVSPPSPLAGVSAWAVGGLIGCMLLWSFLGQVDIVAIAPGKLIPSGHSKTIQPLNTATIRQIYVKEGMEVKKGQLLIALDPTLAAADKYKTQDALLHTLLMIARSEALLLALSKQSEPIFLIPEAINQSDNHLEITREKQLLASQWQTYQAKITANETEILRQQAEYEAAKDQVNKLSQTLLIVTQRAKDYLHLTKQHFVSKHQYLEKEQARIETAQDLLSQRNKVKELKAAIQALIHQKMSQTALFKEELTEVLNTAQKQQTQLAQEHIKTTQQHSHTQLLAPVDGVVQGLSVHTVGGVITPAQILMHIVPKDEVLEVEAWVSNKDIGFVQRGQRAAIKIETFQYTRYGLLEGVVQHVSSDAISDEKRGLIYAVRIQLPRTYMWADGNKVNLVPGMAVYADIKTGKRRLIHYFLTPFVTHANESLRER